MPKSSALDPFYRVSRLGILVSVAGIIAAWLLLPARAFDGPWVGAVHDGLLKDDFARRWDGGCAGWTRALATWAIVGNCCLWIAYVCIAFYLARLHPIPAYVKTAKAMVVGVFVIFLGCGLGHLLWAYATFHPVYVLAVAEDFLNGVVSLVGAVLIGLSLVYATHMNQKMLAEIPKSEAE